jgi:hypothetical protein
MAAPQQRRNAISYPSAQGAKNGFVTKTEHGQHSPVGDDVSGEDVLLDRDVANEGRNAGLCADCGHMRKMESDRGTIFFLCQKSATDCEFPKYPRLPVLQCRGYEPKKRSESGHS